MADAKDAQLKFLLIECWLLTVAAAFGHIRIYQDHIGQGQRRQFVLGLHTYIEEQIVPEYRRRTAPDHIANIQCLQQESRNGILHDAQLQFGVCQKLLNLYLKYLWCLGGVPEPPHCPIDRRIQMKIPKSDRINWSTMDEGQYSTVIGKIQQLAQEERLTIAQYELRYFNRAILDLMPVQVS